MTPDVAELIAAYPRPESCGSEHPEIPGLTCHLSPHGPDARHYGDGRTWPVTP